MSKRKYTEVGYVEELKEKIRNTETELQMLKTKLEKATKNLQDICTHDEFTAVDNGDYHKSGWYYTCNDCGYFTCRKPANSIIIYSR